ncbi:MAG TPA: xanthine dehydrogenase family protein molybdopterin-binding subunit [Thermoanaerobaculia bacterium]|nr:xanthine dehydrogenase family protein molybdopterin-binding subunit [Thermoanaerobaculia bacterium]
MAAVSRAVGSPLERVDGRLKVTGTAPYAAEARHDRLAYAVLVQSTIARGRIATLDPAAARSAPGVLTVLTHETMPPLKASKTGEPGEDRLPLADAVIHYAGQHVALVVAETLEEAQHAAGLVAVQYREEEPVLDFRRAAAAAPERWFGQPLQYRRGDVEAALRAAGAVKVEATYTTPVETHNPMEPSATVAYWQGDRLTVTDATQSVVTTRDFLAELFDLPKEKVRVLCPYTGGGFGGKGSQWPHTVLAAVAARLLDRPVQLNLTRQQMFTSSGHRPPTVQTIALAARPDGALTALRHETLHATSFTTDFIEPCGLTTSQVLYACPNLAIPHRVAQVHVAPPTFMRAPGESTGMFALESAMDELAYALRLDPLELRLKNHADADPSTGKPWSSKHLKECYLRGAQRFGWSRRRPEPRSMREGGLLVGWGMATATYPGYRQAASARVELTAEGRATVRTATQDLGTGSYTIFTQVAADALGLPVDRVTCELGDTDFPKAPGSGGSTTAASVSEAIVQAVAALREKLLALAAALPGSPLAGLGPDQVVLAAGRLAAAADSSRGFACAELLTRTGRSALAAEASVRLGKEARAYAIQSWGAQFCEVRIDPLLPRVQVTRWVSVLDVGRVLNPRTSHSQVLGGVTMGIGMALLEHTVHDPRTGRPLTANLAAYAIPVQTDMPEIEVELLDEPDPVINSLGCRGIGEIGITGVAAAIANAVYHATGTRVRSLPIVPESLL